MWSLWLCRPIHMQNWNALGRVVAHCLLLTAVDLEMEVVGTKPGVCRLMIGW